MVNKANPNENMGEVTLEASQAIGWEIHNTSHNTKHSIKWKSFIILESTIKLRSLQKNH